MASWASGQYFSLLFCRFTLHLIEEHPSVGFPLLHVIKPDRADVAKFMNNGRNDVTEGSFRNIFSVKDDDSRAKNGACQVTLKLPHLLNKLMDVAAPGKDFKI